ncbi:GMC family oxidoreductase [Arthrobacter sp. R4]|uniref:GMC family oxidoreductase n=1 Tax=Arthrobacter sp. R4 TaxID=644417 RepID=UPI003EDA9D1B
MTIETPVRHPGPAKDSYDVVIVGSGMGGGTLAYALRDSGCSVLLVERGGFVPQEKANWSPEAVFEKGRYKNAEKWYSEKGEPFSPGTYYYVGGNTKFYGSSLVRFRREDFEAAELEEGTSPAWPFGYDELAPYYSRAEQAYRVHGDHEDDPTLPRKEPFPYPAIGHEPDVQWVADGLRKQGLTPSNIPLGIDLRQGGTCIRCRTCDGFPCRVLAKMDADVACVRPAVATGAVELITGAYVDQVLTDGTGERATGVKITQNGEDFVIDAKTVVVSCGAVNSAALLLRSANDRHPEGLANSSGMVGRNYMVHNNSIMIGIHPNRNKVEFQKTLYINDYLLKGTKEYAYPLGHVQLIGKLQGSMLVGQKPLIPKWALNEAAKHSMDWWLFTEDLPDPKNRVTLRPDNGIQIRWVPNNVRAHKFLVKEMNRVLHKLGYPLVFSETTGIEVNSHQAGTIRAGEDPTTSVLNPNCRTHDISNLFVVDSSFFPSLPVMNPALTIAANAFRVAEHVASSVQETSYSRATQLGDS